MSAAIEHLQKREEKCPGCGHLMGQHSVELGCMEDWDYYGPDAGEHLVGLSKSDGCKCPLTLAQQYHPPHEDEVEA